MFVDYLVDFECIPWPIYNVSQLSHKYVCVIVCEYTVYPKKYVRGFCFAVLCCGYTLTDFPISIRLTSLALWQSNDYPSASKATLMNMDKYFMRIHYEWLHNHNKAKHNKTLCIFLGIYCKQHLSYVSNTILLDTDEAISAVNFATVGSSMAQKFSESVAIFDSFSLHGITPWRDWNIWKRPHRVKCIKQRLVIQ